jgi:hypothetical protein
MPYFEIHMNEWFIAYAHFSNIPILYALYPRQFQPVIPGYACGTVDVQYEYVNKGRKSFSPWKFF